MAPPSRRAAIPLWLRPALAVEQALGALARAAAILVEEIALAWIPPPRRDETTAAVYGAQRMYLAGSEHFERGFFDWEARAIAAPEFPRAGRILIGGAGGGREARALSALGYSVVAFDPSAPLVEGGRRDLAGHPVTLVRASYDDLARAARGEPSSLDLVLRGVSFDAVILGWASLSHVMDAAARLEVLRSARALAPSAPLLLSFLAAGATAPEIGRGRRTLRRWFARMGAPGRAAPGDRFVAWAGFLHVLATDDVRTLATEAGYRVALLDASPYGLALLVPAAR